MAGQGNQQDTDLRFSATLQDNVSPTADQIERRLKALGANKHEIKVFLRAYDEASHKAKQVQEQLNKLPKEHKVRITADSKQIVDAHKHLEALHKLAAIPMNIAVRVKDESEQTLLHIKQRFASTRREIEQMFHSPIAMPIVAGASGAAGMAGSALGLGGSIAGVGGGAVILQKSFEINNKMEQSMIQLQQIMKDNSQAQAELGKVVQVAIKTPFNMPDVLQADIQMRQAGMNPRGPINYQTAGNLAAGTGRSLADTSHALIDAIQAGDYRMLRYMGLNIRQTDFAPGGRFAGQSPSQGIGGLINQTFGGAMQAQSRSFQGTMSNIQDITNMQVLRPAGAGLFAAAKGIATHVENTLEDPNFQRKLGVEIDKVQVGFARLWGQVQRGAQYFKTNLEQPLINLGKQVAQIASLFSHTFGGVLATAAKTFAEAFTAIAKPIASLIQAHPTLVKMFALMEAFKMMGMTKMASPFENFFHSINPLTFSITGLIKSVGGLIALAPKLAIFFIAKNILDMKSATDALNNSFKKFHQDGSAGLDKLQGKLDMLALTTGASAANLKQSAAVVASMGSYSMGDSARGAYAFAGAKDIQKLGSLGYGKASVGLYESELRHYTQSPGGADAAFKTVTQAITATARALNVNLKTAAQDTANALFLFKNQLATRHMSNAEGASVAAQVYGRLQNVPLTAGEIQGRSSLGQVTSPLQKAQALLSQLYQPNQAELTALRKHGFAATDFLSFNSQHFNNLLTHEEGVQSNTSGGQAGLFARMIGPTNVNTGRMYQQRLFNQQVNAMTRSREQPGGLGITLPPLKDVFGQFGVGINTQAMRSPQGAMQEYVRFGKVIQDLEKHLEQVGKDLAVLDVKQGALGQATDAVNNKYAIWQHTMSLAQRDITAYGRKISELSTNVLDPLNLQMSRLQNQMTVYQHEHLVPVQRAQEDWNMVMFKTSNALEDVSFALGKAQFNMSKFGDGLLKGEQAALDNLHALDRYNKELELMKTINLGMQADISTTVIRQGFETTVKPLMGFSLEREQQRAQLKQQQAQLKYDLSFGEGHYQMTKAERTLFQRTEMPLAERLKGIRASVPIIDKATLSQRHLTDVQHRQTLVQRDLTKAMYLAQVGMRPFEDAQFRLGQKIFKVNDHLQVMQHHLSVMQNNFNKAATGAYQFEDALEKLRIAAYKLNREQYSKQVEQGNTQEARQQAINSQKMVRDFGTSGISGQNVEQLKKAAEEFYKAGIINKDTYLAIEGIRDPKKERAHSRGFVGTVGAGAQAVGRDALGLLTGRTELAFGDFVKQQIQSVIGNPLGIATLGGAAAGIGVGAYGVNALRLGAQRGLLEPFERHVMSRMPGPLGRLGPFLADWNVRTTPMQTLFRPFGVGRAALAENAAGALGWMMGGPLGGLLAKTGASQTLGPWLERHPGSLMGSMLLRHGPLSRLPNSITQPGRLNRLFESHGVDNWLTRLIAPSTAGESLGSMNPITRGKDFIAQARNAMSPEQSKKLADSFEKIANDMPPALKNYVNSGVKYGQNVLKEIKNTEHGAKAASVMSRAAKATHAAAKQGVHTARNIHNSAKTQTAAANKGHKNAEQGARNAEKNKKTIEQHHEDVKLFGNDKNGVKALVDDKKGIGALVAAIGVLGSAASVFHSAVGDLLSHLGIGKGAKKAAKAAEDAATWLDGADHPGMVGGAESATNKLGRFGRLGQKLGKFGKFAGRLGGAAGALTIGEDLLKGDIRGAGLNAAWFAPVTGEALLLNTIFGTHANMDPNARGNEWMWSSEATRKHFHLQGKQPRRRPLVGGMQGGALTPQEQEIMDRLRGHSHAAGLANVPFDNYAAILHKDEAVLTASQAANWRKGTLITMPTETTRDQDRRQVLKRTEDDVTKHYQKMADYGLSYYKFRDQSDIDYTKNLADRATKHHTDTQNAELKHGNAVNQIIQTTQAMQKATYGTGWTKIEGITGTYIGRVEKDIHKMDKDLGLTGPKKHAHGGLVGGLAPKGQLIRVAEEGHPEVVIPLAPHRRDRAKHLLSMASSHIGAYAAGGIVGGAGATPADIALFNKWFKQGKYSKYAGSITATKGGIPSNEDALASWGGPGGATINYNKGLNQKGFYHELGHLLDFSGGISDKFKSKFKAIMHIPGSKAWYGDPSQPGYQEHPPVDETFAEAYGWSQMYAGQSFMKNKKAYDKHYWRHIDNGMYGFDPTKFYQMKKIMALMGNIGKFAGGGYVNPFKGDSYTAGRIDMGQDFSGSGPIRAIGDARITGIAQNWYAGQPYLNYQLLSGPEKGRYVYIAEQISNLAKVGSRVKAGDPIAQFAASGTGLETGWGSAVAGTTLAQATTGYKEGQVTAAGTAFSRFLASLGVNTGGSSKGPFTVGGAGALSGGGLTLPKIAHTLKRLRAMGPIGQHVAKALHHHFNLANQISSAGGGMDFSGFHGGGNVAANRALGRRMASRFGWGTGIEWLDLDKLWTQESGWSTTALNKNGGATGIPQLYPPAHAIPKNWGSPAVQIGWGLNYIKDRYGSPSAAWAQYYKHPGGVGSYAAGISSVPRDNFPALLHKGERVLSAAQNAVDHPGHSQKSLMHLVSLEKALEKLRTSIDTDRKGVKDKDEQRHANRELSRIRQDMSAVRILWEKHMTPHGVRGLSTGQLLHGAETFGSSIPHMISAIHKNVVHDAGAFPGAFTGQGSPVGTRLGDIESHLGQTSLGSIYQKYLKDKAGGHKKLAAKDLARFNKGAKQFASSQEGHNMNPELVNQALLSIMGDTHFTSDVQANKFQKSFDITQHLAHPGLISGNLRRKAGHNVKAKGGAGHGGGGVSYGSDAHGGHEVTNQVQHHGGAVAHAADIASAVRGTRVHEDDTSAQVKKVQSAVRNSNSYLQRILNQLRSGKSADISAATKAISQGFKDLKLIGKDLKQAHKDLYNLQKAHGIVVKDTKELKGLLASGNLNGKQRHQALLLLHKEQLAAKEQRKAAEATRQAIHMLHKAHFETVKSIHTVQKDRREIQKVQRALKEKHISIHTAHLELHKLHHKLTGDLHKAALAHIDVHKAHLAETRAHHLTTKALHDTTKAHKSVTEFIKGVNQDQNNVGKDSNREGKGHTAHLSGISFHTGQHTDLLRAIASWHPGQNHAAGLLAVPYDNYVASLHKDEMVLSAGQASAMRHGAKTGAADAKTHGLLANMLGELKNLSTKSTNVNVINNAHGAKLQTTITKPQVRTR